MYQTFDNDATEIIKDATWSFFIMQFPQQQKAIMTTLVGTEVSDYRVSSLFSTDAEQNLNGVLEPEHSSKACHVFRYRTVDHYEDNNSTCLFGQRLD